MNGRAGKQGDDDIILVESPNCGGRRGGVAPSLVVLHYTAMISTETALERLCDPAAEVSAHYLVSERGALYRLVDERQRAWHAGVSSWRDGTDVNSLSIGIELAHPGHDADGACPPFPEAQMRRLERLLRALRDRWRLAPEAVVAHSDVAPGRKIDPGERFDWTRLERLGLAIGPIQTGTENPGDDQFWDDLTVIGYGNWPRDALLDAFRRRFRPQALGAPLEDADARVARGVAARIAAERKARGAPL